jgi:hypothetical protein
MTDKNNQDNTEPKLRAVQSQPPARRGGLGCWITGVTTLLVVAALVAVGLLLPPFNLAARFFGPQFTMLTAQGNAAGLGALVVIADPGDVGQEFGVLINETPVEQMLAADASAGSWVPAAAAAFPLNHALQSSVYSLQTTGEAPRSLNLSLQIPQTATGALLDVYAYSDASDRWSFVPARQVGDAMYATLAELPERIALFQAAPPPQPRVLVAVDVTQQLSDAVAGLANIVAPGGLQPMLDGKLTGSLAPGFDLNAGYLVMPVIRNFVDARALDTQTVGMILNNDAAIRAHAAELAAFAGGYDGVIIDYRDILPEQRDRFTLFMRELRARMQPSGAQLGVVVPAAQNIDGRWDTGAYDWQALGSLVDLMKIDFGPDPSVFVPGESRFADALLTWAVGEVSRDKLLLGLSALSTRQVGGTFTEIGYREALSALGNVTIQTDITDAGTVLPGTQVEASLDGFEAVSGTEADTPLAYIDYLDEQGGTIARMWLGTPDSLRFRMERTLPFALSGVAFDDLLNSGVADGVHDAILDYKLNTPVRFGVPEFALRWRIESADGVIGEVTTGLNEPLVATLEASDGNYAINVEVVSGQSSAAREGAAVAVFAATATPTPLPTATPTPTPAPTATRAPVAAPAAAAPVAVAAGSIVAGQFEFGGHVTNTNTGAAEAMRRAGMNWMKVQIRYTPGASPGGAAEQINAAKSRGFKILLGVVGNPGDLAAGGQGYIQGFASYLGGLASLGPDAIEVWNEPNIDREWPAGQISGAAYADMLRQAHAAIKGANGGVLVISGAPAPTGAEAAFPGRVVNDNTWLSQFVQAGGLQWTDCVGAHYNEGVVGPAQNSGDPRDNYYTRYFGGMLDTYWNIIGGQRPICWTELGYLTPEGFPPLDPFFGWGQNTTVAQQASWLAQAAALSSQSGRVRLMIIWNIDFTFYGADPMAGYAVIRPGGGCPACDALAGAR